MIEQVLPAGKLFKYRGSKFDWSTEVKIGLWYLSLGFIQHNQYESSLLHVDQTGKIGKHLFTVQSSMSRSPLNHFDILETT